MPGPSGRWSSHAARSCALEISSWAGSAGRTTRRCRRASAMKITADLPLPDYLGVLGGIGLTALLRPAAGGEDGCRGDRARFGCRGRDRIDRSADREAEGLPHDRYRRRTGEMPLAARRTAPGRRDRLQARGRRGTARRALSERRRRLLRQCRRADPRGGDRPDGAARADRALRDDLRLQRRRVPLRALPTFSRWSPGGSAWRAFSTFDFASQFDEARRDLESWLAAGQLKSYVDVQEGFENIPKTFCGSSRERTSASRC